MPRVNGPGRPPKAKPKEAGGSGDTDDSQSTSTELATDTTKSLPDHAYTAPQWLLQEKPQPKSFSLPIPPVPTATYKAVQASLGHTAGSPSGRKSRKQVANALTKLRQLQQDHKNQKQKVKNQKEKLANLQARKEEDLDQFRKTKEAEIEESMKALEENLKAQHQKELEELEEQMKQEVLEKFEKDYEEEQAAKRKLEDAEENEMEEGEEEEEKDNEDDEEAGQASDSPAAKKQKTDNDSGEKTPEKELQSEKIQKKIDETKVKLDKLHEQKSEMVWLLKQVIKADAKRKAELLMLKKKEEAMMKG